jgi:hypothetical protein
MKIPMRYLHCVVFLISGLASLAVLSSCSYFAGDLAQIAPSPDSVTTKELPAITGCQVAFQTTSKQDNYISHPAWCCYNPCHCTPTPPEGTPNFGDRCPDCPCCFWCLRRVLDSTDVTGNVVLILEVKDPSNDLTTENSPRISLTNAASGGGGTSGICTLDVPLTSYPLGAGDISGTGLIKTVAFTLRGLSMRFNSSCTRFSSKCRITISFDDCATTFTTAPYDAPAITIPRP